MGERNRVEEVVEKSTPDIQPSCCEHPQCMCRLHAHCGPGRCPPCPGQCDLSPCLHSALLSGYCYSPRETRSALGQDFSAIPPSPIREPTVQPDHVDVHQQKENEYPILSSMVKAAETRYLAPIIASIWEDVCNRRTEHDRSVQLVLASLAGYFDTLSNKGYLLPSDQVVALSEHCRRLFCITDGCRSMPRNNSKLCGMKSRSSTICNMYDSRQRGRTRGGHGATATRIS